VTLSTSDISGLGTIATQAANSVAITGGAIDGTTVGSTTAAAGTFTTLTATGQTSLGGAVGSESFRVVTRASATDYIEADGGTSGTSGVYLSAQGASASTNLFLSAKTASIRFYTNSKGSAEQFRISHTASAVNYVQVTGAATANPPVLSAQGSDATIAMLYQAKGGQDHRFFTNSGSAEQFRVLHTTGTIANQTYATGAIAGASPIIGARGTDTNIDLTLTPKGTGAVKIGASALSTTNFSIVESGGKLIFKYGSTTIASMDSTGIITSVTNIVSNGTP
jgi:hypothetical protein